MDKILKQIAEKNQTTTDEVEKEISAAIKQAMDNSKGNPKAEEFWKNISANGDAPTTAEVIKAIIEKVVSEQ